MPKRKLEATADTTHRIRKAFNKEEMMVEAVDLVLRHNLLTGVASNDTTLIEYANKLNVEELRTFNNKMKQILNI